MKQYIILGFSNDGQIFIGINRNEIEAINVCEEFKTKENYKHFDFNVFLSYENEIFEDLSDSEKINRKICWHSFYVMV